MTTTNLPAETDLAAAAASAAERLVDPAVVADSADGRTRPQSLAGGAAGITLLHIERALAGFGEEATAHAWLRTLAGEPVSAGPNANLYYGAPTLAFVLHIAAPLGGYRRALADLDEATIQITRNRLAAAHARIDRGDALSMVEFDLVHGLVGLGVYHLQAHSEHPITADVLAYLARLTEPLDVTTGRVPWWLPSGLGGTPDPDFPHGHGNLGVAHGVSAVIAILSLAILRGHAAPATQTLSPFSATGSISSASMATPPDLGGLDTSRPARLVHGATDPHGATAPPVSPALSNLPVSLCVTLPGRSSRRTPCWPYSRTPPSAPASLRSASAMVEPVCSKQPGVWPSPVPTHTLRAGFTQNCAGWPHNWRVSWSSPEQRVPS
nr:lanthionine synthetase LanC family protein [Jiangella muralis]